MQVIADTAQLHAVLDRMVEQVRALMAREAEGRWAFVGLRSRGDLIARRLADLLKPAHHGALDIALYRDDLSEVGPQITVRPTEMDFPMDGTNVLLVDDVLMSGRSARAAMQSLMDFGRPRVVRLAVMIDRGLRELPIAADIVGFEHDAPADQVIEVRMQPTDPTDEVVIFSRNQPPAESSS